LRIAEGRQEIELIGKRYRLWSDKRAIIILRLRGFEGKRDDTRISEDVGLDGSRAYIKCRSCRRGDGLWSRCLGGIWKGLLFRVYTETYGGWKVGLSACIWETTKNVSYTKLYPEEMQRD